MDYEYLFIDIMLLQASGIELAKKVKNKQTKIIFVSANEALVYDCFDIHLYFFIRKAKRDFPWQGIPVPELCAGWKSP